MLIGKNLARISWTRAVCAVWRISYTGGVA